MNKKKAYNIFIGVLAILAVILVIMDITKGLNSNLIIVDRTIYFIFLFDYLIRLHISDDKSLFFKRNIPDLISILPFNSVFKAFKVFRLGRLLKMSKLIKAMRLTRIVAFSVRLLENTKDLMGTNGLKYTISFTVISILVGGVSIDLLENTGLNNGIWWAFVTTTTVGYGDISPTSLGGRMIAVFLMLVGIGLIGSLTSSITSYFVNPKSKKLSTRETILNLICAQIKDIDNLTTDDIEEIYKLLKQMKEG